MGPAHCRRASGPAAACLEVLFMPPISPQGSRTAQVTWLVVFAILFVVSTIFGIYAYVAMDKATTQLEDFRKRYMPDIVADADLTGPALNDLKEKRQNPPEGSPI